jgi:hypothetical protein
MKLASTLTSMLLVLLLVGQGASSQAISIGWPEAVARLAGERSKAETCVALLKGHGDGAQISRGRLVYVNAKANSDAVISGLVIALAQDRQPESLASLEVKLERGASGLVEFCKTVGDLLLGTSGEKGVLVDIVRLAIAPLLKSLSEGVATLYNNHRKDDALTRLTIQTQLESSKWPDFAEVKAAK